MGARRYGNVASVSRTQLDFEGLLCAAQSQPADFRFGHVEVSQNGWLDGFQIHEIDLPVS